MVFDEVENFALQAACVGGAPLASAPVARCPMRLGVVGDASAAGDGVLVSRGSYLV
jgi:hypothetical protein